ncbi:MAG: DMT family transporter [candidate division Zixibacteria bacterium]|nr:DMT family transporter [candidate division Zixibacteria bacterium]
MPKQVFKNAAVDLGLFYSAAIWGSTFFIVKDTLNFISPTLLVGYRFTLAALILVIYLIIKRRNLFTNIKQGLFMGLFLWLLYITQTIGLKITSASNSGFITGLFVAFVPIFAFLMFKKRPTYFGLAAVGLSLIGLWLLSGGMKELNTGDILTLAAAMSYAIHILLADRYLKGGTNPYVLCFQQFAFVGIVSLLLGIFDSSTHIPHDNSAIWIIVFLAIFPTLSAFVIQLLAQRFVSPLRVSLIFAFEPVFAALFAWTLGGEVFRPERALGGLLIFIAMVVSGLERPEKSRGYT